MYTTVANLTSFFKIGNTCLAKKANRNTPALQQCVRISFRLKQHLTPGLFDRLLDRSNRKHDIHAFSSTPDRRNREQTHTIRIFRDGWSHDGSKRCP